MMLEANGRHTFQFDQKLGVDHIGECLVGTVPIILFGLNIFFFVNVYLNSDEKLLRLKDFTFHVQ